MDLTWVTSNLMECVYKWSVLQNVETFSDHQYIEILLRNPAKFKKNNSFKHRWNFKKLDEELFEQVLEFLLNAEKPVECGTSIERYAAWIGEIMHSACNAAAPIIKSKNNKRQVYWWSDRIAELRRTATKCRRNGMEAVFARVLQNKNIKWLKKSYVKLLKRRKMMRGMNLF